jgi:aromatic ring hydroxylase
MKDVAANSKQTRNRCSDEDFLEAVFSSKTYAEIALKTGQKITSTMARYARTKKLLLEKGITLPEMQRKKPQKKVDNIDNMVSIVQRLKAHHSES